MRDWFTAPGLGAAVIGIDVGGTKIDIGLADDQGTLIDRVRLDTLAELGPRQALKRTVTAAVELAQRTPDRASPVAEYAVVMPGIIKAGRLLLSPNLPGWENIALARYLTRALDVDTIAICNDVRAGALAELRFGALRGSEPGIYVSLGTGVAAALTIGGRVVGGAHQAAGEIGYIIPRTNGAVAADAGATLEDLIGGKALSQRARTALANDPVSASLLFTASDRVVRRIALDGLDALAAVIVDLALFVDPQRVVVGGGLMAAADTILPRLSDHLRQALPFPPEVIAASFTQDASLHGAIALALDKLAARNIRSERPEPAVAGGVGP